MDEAVLRIIMQDSGAATTGAARGSIAPTTSAGGSSMIAQPVMLVHEQFRKITDQLNTLYDIRRHIAAIADVVTGMRSSGVSKSYNGLEYKTQLDSIATSAAYTTTWLSLIHGVAKNTDKSIAKIHDYLKPESTTINYTRMGFSPRLGGISQASANQPHTLGMTGSGLDPNAYTTQSPEVINRPNALFRLISGIRESVSRVGTTVRRGIFGRTASDSSDQAVGGLDGTPPPQSYMLSDDKTANEPIIDAIVHAEEAIVNAILPKTGSGTGASYAAATEMTSRMGEIHGPPEPPPSAGPEITEGFTHERGWNLVASNKDKLIAAGIRASGDRSAITDSEYAAYVAHRQSLGLAPEFAGGGWVNGPSGTDTIPAWLTKDEFVVNANAAKANKGLLEWINAKHMSVGGIVGAATSAVSTITGFAGAASGDPASSMMLMGRAIQGIGSVASSAVPALGAMVGAISGATTAVGSFMGALNSTVDRYAEYSPEIATAQGMAEVAQVMGDLRRSQEIGSQMAEYVMAKADLQQKFEDIKVKLLTQIVPVVTRILEFVEMILPSGESIAGSIDGVAEGISELTDRVAQLMNIRREARIPLPDDPTNILFRNGAMGVLVPDTTPAINPNTSQRQG